MMENMSMRTAALMAAVWCSACGASEAGNKPSETTHESTQNPDAGEPELDGGNPGDAALGDAGPPTQFCVALAECCKELEGEYLSKCEADLATGDEYDCEARLNWFRYLQGVCLEPVPPDPVYDLPAVELDGAWQTKQQLDRVPPFADTFLAAPQVTTCGDERAFAAWNRGAPLGVISTISYAGGAWSGVQNVDADDGLGSQYLTVAANAACEAIVAWVDVLPVEGGDDEYTFSAVKRGANGTFGAQVALLTRDEGDGIHGRRTALSDSSGGELMYDLGDELVHFAERDGKFARVDSPALTPLEDLVLLADGHGLAIGTVANETGGSSLQYIARTVAGEWSAPMPVPSLEGGAEQVEMLDAGDRAYVAWLTSEGRKLVAYDPVSGFGAVQTLPSEIPTFAKLTARRDQVYAAWRNDDDVLLSARIMEGNDAAAPTILSAPNHRVWDYDLAIDDRGRVTVAYEIDAEGLFANRLTPEAGWSGPHLLSREGGTPDVTVSPGGRVFVSWSGLSELALLTYELGAWIMEFTPSQIGSVPSASR